MTELVRTKRDGCWQVRSNSWGAYLQRVDDPLADAELDDGALERFELNSGITPIPADLWSRWIKLCFHFCDKVPSHLEVSCRLLRHEDDKSQWRILVPVQSVDGASVRVDSFDKAIDIATGDVIEHYPPAGWVPCGSSHSHNSMQLDRFSGTDDHYELGDPGLHIVISHINAADDSYRATASITANRRRFYLPDASAVVDSSPAAVTFHPNVLQAVKTERPRAWPSLALWANPNAGNGYTIVGHKSEPEAPLWWSPSASSKSLEIEADVFDEPLCTAMLQRVNALLRDGAMQDAEALLDQLIDLTHLISDTLEANSDDPTIPQPSDSTTGAHPTTAARHDPGEW